MEYPVHDILIIGGGAAGLRAAIAAAEARPDISVALVSKVYPMRSHTVSAEGGTAGVLRSDDTFDSHAYDTVKGSDFLTDQDAVELFVRAAPEEILQLEHWGCPWSRDPDGGIAVRAFGGMSVKRTVYAADKTGFHLLHTLFQTSLRYSNIRRYDEWFVTALLVDDGRILGVTALDVRSGQFLPLLARAVILATGGCGRVFAFTTNGMIKTGDGMALAYRIGAALKDMEFIQYHPTGLPGTGILITEASRGEGGYLLNAQEERFLQRYVPSRMELGPRDLLSRAIITEMEEGRAFQGPYGAYVQLDLRHLGERLINERLPFVRELTQEYLGIDPVREPIPVRPVVHYSMGGVDTDTEGKTSITGLYAAGEVACVSINGANRLGSNSLSECLVFGARAGRAAAHGAADAPAPRAEVIAGRAADEERRVAAWLTRAEGTERLAALRDDLRHGMERGVGVFRTGEGLREVLGKIHDLRGRLARVTLDDRSRIFNTEWTAALELEFMIDVAEAIAIAALAREESRGSHTRRDFPQRDDVRFLKHSLAFWSREGPRVGYRDVAITRWPPEERKY
ncbi:MAG: FAD-binding protein [Armatimonadetes bacterium]|nr:FAD-binding protein [Armatimonadota bacterium]